MADTNGVGNRNGHGGARSGAGRKPKALKYASELAAAEGKIISALPDVIDGLIERAKAGDIQAAKYLLDRAFGRVQTQAAPLADDKSTPFDDEDWESQKRRAVAERNHADKATEMLAAWN